MSQTSREITSLSYVRSSAPLTLLLWMTLTVCAVSASDWPTYQHDVRRTGFTEERIEPSELALLWTWRSPHPPQPAWAGPAKWDAYAKRRDLPSMRSYDLAFCPIAVGDSVFFGSSTDDSVYCVDASSGQEKWSYTTDGPVRVAPSAANGKLYFGSDDGYAYCLRSADGTLVWRFRPEVVGVQALACPPQPEGCTPADIPDRPRYRKILNNGRLISPHPCRTGILIDDGIAYFANALLPWKDAYLCAVDAETGLAEGSECYVRRYNGLTLEGAPAATAQLLVFPQGRVAPQLFRRADGNNQGQLKKSSGGSIVVAALDSTIFHGPGADSRKGAIHSSSSTTLEMIASHGRARAMVVAGSVTYMLTDNALIASDLGTRKTLWNVPSHCPYSLIATGDVLYAGGDDEVAAFAANDGKLLWQHPVEGRAYSLAATNGRLLACTDDGALHAFGAAASSVAQEGVSPSQDSSDTPGREDKVELTPVVPIERKGLLGRWVFQKPHTVGKTVRDLAGNAPGTILGNVHLSQAGEHQALEFDGREQSVLVAGDYTQVRVPEESITAEAWVRVDEPLTWGGIVGIIQDNGSYERGWILGYRASKFSFALAGEDGNGRLTYLTAKTDFQARRWYHVVGTYDGTTMRLFVDGRLENTSTIQRGSIHYPPKALYEIGAYHDDDENFRLSGMIHEVCVYGDALSAQEVARRYTSKASRFPTPAAPPKTIRLAAGPWLQFVEPGVATVRWRTAEPSPTRLDYRLDESPTKVEDAVLKSKHEVRLSGLRHNRVYRYVIYRKTDDGMQATREYECDTFYNYTLPPAPRGLASGPMEEAGPASRAAEQILSRTRIHRGICLVAGSGEGRLARELAQRSQLRIIGVESDPEKVKVSRDALKKAKLYGVRVTIHHVPRLDALPFIDSFANLVVSERLLDGAEFPCGASEVLRLLRPDGGIAYVGQPRDAQRPLTADQLREWLKATSVKGDVTDDGQGIWARVVRDPLPGAADWSHLYGRPDNSAFAGEQLGGAKTAKDLQIQWIGRPGPRFQPDRNGRKPSPLSTGGRLFVQGLHRMAALDAYNGAVLWSLEIPDLERFNMPRDCGNWCADRRFVYAAIRDKCWQIDATNGHVVRLHDVDPAAAQDWRNDWGYLASVEDKIIGSTVKEGASWTNFWGGADAGWYDARSGAVTDKICSDQLFAIEKETGATAWTRAGGLVLNSTITITKNRVFLVECRHPAIIEGKQRRVGGENLWQRQYLVALDAQTGMLLWESPIDTEDGTVVFYMAHSKNRLVIVSSTGGKYHVNALSDKDGQPAWNQSFGWPGGKGDHGKAMSRPAIVGDRVLVRPMVFSLTDGTPQSQHMPGGGCGTYGCSTNAVFFRSGTVTMWSPETGGSSTWKRLRPDCWLSTIPAAGMLLSPEGGGGCSCGTWLEASVGFLPINASELDDS